MGSRHESSCPRGAPRPDRDAERKERPARPRFQATSKGPLRPLAGLRLSRRPGRERRDAQARPRHRRSAVPVRPARGVPGTPACRPGLPNWHLGGARSTRKLVGAGHRESARSGAVYITSDPRWRHHRAPSIQRPLALHEQTLIGCIAPLIARAAPFGARLRDLFFCYRLTNLACDGRTEGSRPESVRGSMTVGTNRAQSGMPRAP